MKQGTKKEKVWDTLKPPPGAEPPPSGKVVVPKTAKGAKQQPPRPGYHGTDDEKELNPEE